MNGLRHLIVVFGDQLNHDASAFEGFDPSVDQVWMAEVPEESQNQNRAACMPVHHALLGLPASAREEAQEESAHVTSGS